MQLTEHEIIEDEMALSDVLDVPGQVYFFGHHQNNVARVSGHLKNKQELIEGFRRNCIIWKSISLKYWIFH